MGKRLLKKTITPLLFSAVCLFTLVSCDGFLGMDIIVMEPNNFTPGEQSKIFDVETDEDNAEQSLAKFTPGKPLKDVEIEVLENAGSQKLIRLCLLHTSENGTCRFGQVYTPDDYTVVIKAKRDGYKPATYSFLHDNARINHIIIFLVPSY